MKHNLANGLLPIEMPTQKSLRNAIANIIRDIQRDAGETDQETADNLGVSKGTIQNARNESTDLNAVTIARIGAKYGAHYVDPYHRLYGAVARALEINKADPLASIAEAVSTICKMRAPDSPGGSNEMPKEQLDALPILKSAIQDMTAYVASIEKLRVAA